MTSPDIDYDILVEDERWHEALPDHASLVAMSLDRILRSISGFETAEEVELSITLTNDAQIQTLNRDYRDKDKPTNVLSFPQIEWVDSKPATQEPLMMLGDVVIALETIQREANEQEKRLQDHFIHMLIHSVLHLCGHDHEIESEAETMENLEIRILSEMGIKNPYQTL
jgi:probable rRNA maturation factor